MEAADIGEPTLLMKEDAGISILDWTSVNQKNIIYIVSRVEMIGCDQNRTINFIMKTSAVRCNIDFAE